MQMKKIVTFGTMLAAFILISINVRTQDSNEANETINYSMPAMRVLDLEGTAPSLTFVAPTEGGTNIADATANSSWINYTSIVSSGVTNKITVSISGNAVPDGTQLKVEAAEYTGNGDGTFGTPSGQIILSSSAQELITAIGSCYTGTGNTNGHQLTYTWSIEPDGYASLAAGGSSGITATYTIIAGL